MNNTYLVFWNVQRQHRFTDSCAANDDAVRRTRHGEFSIMDIMDVSDKGMPAKSREEPAKQEAGNHMSGDVLILRTKNHGCPAARNIGFQHSSGDFLVFLESDDRLKPGALEDHLSS